MSITGTPCGIDPKIKGTEGLNLDQWRKFNPSVPFTRGLGEGIHFSAAAGRDFRLAKMSEVCDTLRSLLAEIPGLELAFLFGSRAAGGARLDSDIDLAVLAQRPISAELKLALTETVAAEFNCAVDLVDLFGAPEPITGEALRGIRLLGDDSAYATLLTRHVMNVADFLPLRQRILDERRAAWIH